LQKSQIPEKGFAQIKKQYHNLNLIPATERYIAEIKSVDNKKSRAIGDPACLNVF